MPVYLILDAGKRHNNETTMQLYCLGITNRDRKRLEGIRHKTQLTEPGNGYSVHQNNNDGIFNEYQKTKKTSKIKIFLNLILTTLRVYRRIPGWYCGNVMNRKLEPGKEVGAGK